MQQKHSIILCFARSMGKFPFYLAYKRLLQRSPTINHSRPKFALMHSVFKLFSFVGEVSPYVSTPRCARVCQKSASRRKRKSRQPRAVRGFATTPSAGTPRDAPSSFCSSSNFALALKLPTPTKLSPNYALSALNVNKFA